MPLAAASRLGPYEIVSLLGAGGMGHVYEARDPRLGRTVAIKVLTVESGDPDAADRLERFRREARAISRLSHPHICSLLDVGEEGGRAFLVMEHLNGQTLAAHMAEGRVPLERALRYGAQVASALDAAHREGVVHRDLKPANIMVTREGVKLLDFGLARLRPQPDDALSLDDTADLTTEGTILGTVPYMAPEQLDGKTADGRADIFALGVVLYEMICGRRPFAGESKARIMAAILEQEPPPPSSVRAEVSPALDHVLGRCLAKDPEERWQIARDLCGELRWLEDEANAGSSSDRARPARKWLGWGGAAAAGALVAGGTLWLLAARGIVDPGPAAPAPSFRRVTVRSGTVSSARFAPDGETMVYSAAWEARPYELFLARAGSTEARPLGLTEARILAVSAASELAFISGPQRLAVGQGTLARVPLSGGAPRELLEDVREADWMPGGSELAVARRVAGDDQVEFPAGRAVYKARNVWSLRVSRDGRRVAFFAGPSHARGEMVVVDASGRSTILSTGWQAAAGLAWSPEGDEIWFTGTRGDVAPAVFAVSLAGRERTLLRAPESLYLNDVFRDGRVLLTSMNDRILAACRPAGEAVDRELGWLDASWVEDLSADGGMLLFSETHAKGVYVRAVAGEPAVRLGDGHAEGLSPDLKWVLARAGEPPQWVLLPTGPGSPRKLPRGEGGHLVEGDWLPDGRRIVFSATAQGGGSRVYVQDVGDGAIRVLSAQEATIPLNAPTPDGRYVTAWQDGKVVLLPLNGGAPVPVPHLEPGDTPLQWSADGRFLFVRRRGGPVPAQVDRVDVVSGGRAPWKTLGPRDATGVERVHPVVMTPDGASYCYSYARKLTQLFVVDGLN